MLLRVTQRVEGAGDPVEPDRSGEERRRVDFAVGEHVEGLAELRRGVAEDEAQVDLLVDGERRANPVVTHADADDDNA